MLEWTCEWVESLPSTNETLKRRLEAGEPLASGTVLAARAQTEGRGRSGRTWFSGSGRDLTFSFVLRTPADPQRRTSLSLAVALGVAEWLAGRSIRRVGTKWPNDVWAGDRKICGILAEQVSGSDVEPPIVVGVGINVNMTREEAVAIDRPATSMRLETGRTYRVETLLPTLLEVLSDWIERWESGGFPALRSAWERLCLFQGQTVTVRDGSRRVSGRLSGFGEYGELLLRTEPGMIKPVWSGDVAITSGSSFEGESAASTSEREPTGRAGP